MALAMEQFFLAWGGAKRANIRFQLLSQFQIFLNQTFFSQMKDIKHIRQDFHSVSWVMPQGWDLRGYKGVGGGGGGRIFFF